MRHANNMNIEIQKKAYPYFSGHRGHFINHRVPVGPFICLRQTAQAATGLLS